MRRAPSRCCARASGSQDSSHLVGRRQRDGRASATCRDLGAVESAEWRRKTAPCVRNVHAAPRAPERARRAYERRDGGLSSRSSVRPEPMVYLAREARDRHLDRTWRWAFPRFSITGRTAFRGALSRRIHGERRTPRRGPRIGQVLRAGVSLDRIELSIGKGRRHRDGCAPDLREKCTLASIAY